MLPLVDEQRAVRRRGERKIGLRNAAHIRIIKEPSGVGAAFGCVGFPDTFRSVNGDCGQVRHEKVELVV
ncbi:hypothetical protein ACF3NP_07555 [Corynebacterium lehmanniae]|uniref:hypothetical protein n=1 Tax=Corynebacterium haemomassiliense TaxID=2754726 RepID=UPI00370D9B77